MLATVVLGSAAAGAACTTLGVALGEPVPVPAPAAIETTLFLIGDAGAPAEHEQVLAVLERQAREAIEDRAIVYLGDNIYPAGLPDTGSLGREAAARALDAQIAVGVRTGTPTYFVPGNHDWDYMGPLGWERILRQGAYIRVNGAPWITLLPEGGCPGPVVRDMGSRLRLVFLDTQWWLHDFEKPVDSTSGCRYTARPEVIKALDGALVEAGDRHVVVVAHHPLRSGGTHGGHLGWQSHLFPLRLVSDWLWVPLPIIGSSYALNRKQGASNQDVSGPENVVMRRAFDWVFARRKPLVYASGHEHDLQVIEGATARHVLISGSGIFGHVTETHYIDGTRYAASLSGFMRLDVLRNGQVRLGVMTVTSDSVATERYSAYLE